MACSRPTVLARQKRGWSWLLVGAQLAATPLPLPLPRRAVSIPVPGGCEPAGLESTGPKCPDHCRRVAHTNSPAAGASHAPKV